MSFRSLPNKTHFRIKGLALDVALKQRHEVTHSCSWEILFFPSEFGRGYEWKPKQVTCYQGDTIKVNSAAKQTRGKVLYSDLALKDGSHAQPRMAKKKTHNSINIYSILY